MHCSTCYQSISPWYRPLEIGFCYSICLEKTLQICYIFVIRQPVKYLSFQATFIFSLINACPCPSLCRFRSGHNLGKNKSCLKWKKTSYYISFLIIKIWQILKRFCRTKTLANISHFWWVCTYIHTCCLKPRCSGYVLLPEKLGFLGILPVVVLPLVLRSSRW